MNTGQSLITILAMLLLSILILRVNNVYLNTGSALSYSKLEIIATSLASSRLDEICTKAYDENSVSAAINDSSKFTSPSKLGPESGEVYPDFDDVDDYNKFSINDSVKLLSNNPAEVFRDSCIVQYVAISGGKDFVTNYQTWNKKITVMVWDKNKSMPDTVTLSRIFSYWYFK
jgi:hypothetical protein